MTLGSRTLKSGSAGTDVRELQEKLVALGFDVGSCGVDGDFGEDTEKAVKLFQKANGLEATGVYDAGTHTRLTAPEAAEKTVSEPVTEEKPAGLSVQIVSENGGSVNVRCGNSTDFKSITTVKTGTTFDYVATAANGWNAVVIGKQVGWVSGKYSRIV